jgi:hypothetical protein
MSISLRALLGAVILCVLTTGCAVNRATANVDPTARLDKIKTIQVKHHEPDERGIDKLIADNLRARGYSVVTGDQAAAGVDARLTYVDKWFWDITMYMLELTIQLREPATDYPIASGNSFHTSLTRKSPPEMVDEVIGNILNEGKTRK